MPLNSDSWDSDGNLLVPLHGIRIALGLAFVAASAFWRFASIGDQQSHQQHPDAGVGAFISPLWMTILRAAVPLVPFVVSWLLVSTRSEQSKAAGAGVAAAVFICGFLFALAFLFFLTHGFAPELYVREIIVALLTFLGCSAWIIVSAFRIGNASWGVFFLAFVPTLICMVSASEALKNADYDLSQQNEQRKREAARVMFVPVDDAQHRLAFLAGCLLLNDSLHPKAGYPSSLDSPPANWSCEIKFAADAVQEYSISYTPQTDSASGRITDFQLTAIPKQRGVRGRYALMVDRRGIVFSDPMWGISNPFIRAATSEGRASEINELRGNIERYMKERRLDAAPPTLNAEAIGAAYGFGVPALKDDGKRLETKNYVFHYLAPRVGETPRFALSVQCQSYGANCLRSYFSDYDGIVHATGEPRQATADDPVALDCEMSDLECKDVGWSIP